MKKLFLVDAYALLFKYYYAFLGRPMRNRNGMNTSVVFGFVKFLRDIQKRERPDLLGVAFDPKGGSFRREIFPEYKANRSETPEDILISVPYVKRVLEAMCIPILEVEGYEADDVIGTLSQRGLRRLRRLHGDARQGLRAAGARTLPHLQAEGLRRGDRDRGPRGHPPEVRHRRSGARARHPRPVGRRLGQYPGGPGHRREDGLQTGSGVGNGRAYPRQRRFDRKGGRARRSPHGATTSVWPSG